MSAYVGERARPRLVPHYTFHDDIRRGNLSLVGLPEIVGLALPSLGRGAEQIFFCVYVCVCACARATNRGSSYHLIALLVFASLHCLDALKSCCLREPLTVHR